MSKILLITGTDTGVGKTIATCHLFAGLKSLGYNVGIVKPCETGCHVSQDGELIPADGSIYQSLLGDSTSLSDIVYHRFELPVAPWVAALNVNSTIDYSNLIARLKADSSRFDILLCEGAGGLLVPITADKNFADLAADAGMSAIVVAASRLGVLNHCLLTFESLRNRKINTLGYIMNEALDLRDSSDISRSSNRQILRSLAERYGVEELGYLPHIKQPQSASSFYSAQALDSGAKRLIDLLELRS